MSLLLDTNILLRLAVPQDPAHPGIVEAVRRLARRGESTWICSQNLVELWNVASRPLAKNGLGLTPPEAGRLIDHCEQSFERLPDTDAVFGVWKELVLRFNVSGAMVHDTRLVAVMKVNRVDSLLTLNGQDFRRFLPEGIAVLGPEDIS